MTEQVNARLAADRAWTKQAKGPTRRLNGSQPHRGFVTVGTNSIMNTKFEPLRWTIPGYVPEGLTLLAGRQKLGKTWLAIDFAIAKAIGGYAMSNIECERVMSSTSTWRTGRGALSGASRDCFRMSGAGRI